MDAAARCVSMWPASPIVPGRILTGLRRVTRSEPEFSSLNTSEIFLQNEKDNPIERQQLSQPTGRSEEALKPPKPLSSKRKNLSPISNSPIPPSLPGDLRHGYVADRGAEGGH